VNDSSRCEAASGIRGSFEAPATTGRIKNCKKRRPAAYADYIKPVSDDCTTGALIKGCRNRRQYGPDVALRRDRFAVTDRHSGGDKANVQNPICPILEQQRSPPAQRAP